MEYFKPNKKDYTKSNWKKIIKLIKDGKHPFGAENTEWYKDEL